MALPVSPFFLGWVCEFFLSAWAAQDHAALKGEILAAAWRFLCIFLSCHSVAHFPCISPSPSDLHLCASSRPLCFVAPLTLLQNHPQNEVKYISTAYLSCFSVIEDFISLQLVKNLKQCFTPFVEIIVFYCWALNSSCLIESSLFFLINLTEK